MVGLHLLLTFWISILSTITAAAVVPAAVTNTPSLIRRDDAAEATFTVGDVHQYVPGQPTDADPSGTSMMLYPTGFHDVFPPEGIRLAFGPELQKRISDVVNEKCQPPTDIGQCGAEIAKCFPTTDLSTHSKRFVVATAFAALVAITSVTIAAIMTALSLAESPKIVQFRPDTLSQINSWSTASVIAIATSSDEKVVGTATVVPLPVPTEGEHLTVTLVAEDKDDLKKGDIILTVPEDLELRVLDFLAQMGLEGARDSCKTAIPNSKKTLNGRAPDDDPPVENLEDTCARNILNLGGALLEAQADMLARMRPIEPNNPLNPDMIPHGGGVPNFVVADMAMIVELVRRGYGNGGVPDDGAPGVELLQERIVRATISLNIIYAIIFLGVKGLRSIHLPGSHLKSHKADEFTCPRDELICLDETCGGEVLDALKGEGMRLRQTGYCTEGQNKFCTCTVLPEPIVYEVENDWAQDQYALLGTLVELFNKKTVDAFKPDCDSSAKIPGDGDWLAEKILQACDNVPLRKRERGDRVRRKNSWNWHDDNFQGLSWHFDWDDKGNECPYTCPDVFMHIAEDKNCVNGAEISSLTTLKTDCGDARIEVFKYNAPVDNDSWDSYRLAMHQVVNPGGESFTEWTVFMGETDSSIQGPEKHSVVESVPFYVEIQTDNPNDKDTTDVKFVVAMNANPDSERKERFNTGTTDDVESGHHVVAKAQWPSAFCFAFGDNWKGLEGVENGFYRDFNCYISRDFDKVFNDHCGQAGFLCWG